MGKEIWWMAVTLSGNRKVPRSQVFRIMGYGRKPLCPRCGNPLSVVSEGATGFANMKCIRCKKTSIVNLQSLETQEIVDDLSEIQK